MPAGNSQITLCILNYIILCKCKWFYLHSRVLVVELKSNCNITLSDPACENCAYIHEIQFIVYLSPLKLKFNIIMVLHNNYYVVTTIVSCYFYAKQATGKCFLACHDMQG